MHQIIWFNGEWFMGTFKDTLNVKVNQGELISKISILE